jgi:L-lactate dehydrogenase complex protein LldF
MRNTDDRMNQYARHEHHDFTGATAEALADQGLQSALVRLTDTLMAGNRRGYAALADSDRLRDHAKRIKEHTLAHLDRYLEQLEASVQKLGGTVNWATTAAEARQIIVDIARRANCRHAVKSKSMTSEEIHLNPALEAAGIDVTETDLGEYILQVAGERPSHLVAPAVHHTRESVARVLSKHLGQVLPDDPKALAMSGRRVLRDKFYRADLGITGVNFAVAETGTVVLVTNEGNGRLTTTCPRVHVALMGMEKVIPRMRDLPTFLKLLARGATGQTLSVYTTLLTGKRRAGEVDGPEEFHLVILDNGRSKILASPFRESLQCIRCGACLNACPVYRRIGGHAYGGVYGGPIGSILTPLFDSVSDNPQLPHA